MDNWISEHRVYDSSAWTGIGTSYSGEIDQARKIGNPTQTDLSQRLLSSVRGFPVNGFSAAATALLGTCILFWGFGLVRQPEDYAPNIITELGGIGLEVALILSVLNWIESKRREADQVAMIAAAEQEASSLFAETRDHLLSAASAFNRTWAEEAEDGNGIIRLGPQVRVLKEPAVTLQLLYQASLKFRPELRDALPELRKVCGEVERLGNELVVLHEAKTTKSASIAVRSWDDGWLIGSTYVAQAALLPKTWGRLNRLAERSKLFQTSNSATTDVPEPILTASQNLRELGEKYRNHVGVSKHAFVSQRGSEPGDY